MTLTKRLLQEGDAEIANKWLLGWRLMDLPLTMYPDTGLVLENEDEAVFMGFIWTSNSGMAQIGFITRNPNVKKIPEGTRKNFIHELVLECYNMGYKHVISWAENKLLVNDMKELGFAEKSDKCSELIIYKLEQ